MGTREMTIRRLQHEGLWLEFPGSTAGVRGKLTADLDIDGLPYDVTATVLVDAVTGQPSVDALSLRRRPGGPPIQSGHLRMLPASEIAKTVFERALMGVTTTTEGDKKRMSFDLSPGSSPEGSPDLVRQVARSRRERGQHGDTVRRAAAAFKAAEERRDSDPLQAVQQALDCSESYAKSLVSEARNSPAQLLPRLSRRRTRAEVVSTFADEWTMVSEAGSSPSVADMARKLGRSARYIEGLLKEAIETGLLSGQAGVLSEDLDTEEKP
jgi:hypothetical protein